MYWTCYLRKKILYLPTEAKVKTGGYMGIDPVFTASVYDKNAINSALKEVIGKGNPIIPEILRDDYPEPCLLKYAGVKSWGAFARGAHLWGVWEEDGFYTITPKKRMQPRGWVDDKDRAVTLPPGATIDELCDKLIAMVQAKAAEQ